MSLYVNDIMILVCGCFFPLGGTPPPPQPFAEFFCRQVFAEFWGALPPYLKVRKFDTGIISQ